MDCHLPCLQPTSASPSSFVVSLAVADFGVGMIAVPPRFFCNLTTECTPRFETFDFNLQQNLLWSNVFSLKH